MLHCLLRQRPCLFCARGLHFESCILWEDICSKPKCIAAAVSCSLSVYRLGGVGLGSGTMGKLGRAWAGAWVVHGLVHGVVHGVVYIAPHCSIPFNAPPRITP